MVTSEHFEALLKDIDSLKIQLHGQDWEFQIWPSNKLNEFNQAYNVEEYLPGYFAFGSDGGLEMLTVELSTGRIYSIPFIPMESENRIKIADSLEALITKEN